MLGGPADPAELDLDGYRRAMRVNVDGVVLGVRRLARVMPAGGRIVCTASLAGLTAIADDPVYAATKHAVVGFVRSVAPPLADRGIAINAVCPGIADTPMVARRRASGSSEAGFPLLRPQTSPTRSGSRSSRGETGARLGRAAGPAAARLPLPERPRPAHREGGHRSAARRRFLG